jgi:isochorismate synthase
MLQLLHPTSAVCGMPKEESLAFILMNEGYNREFYSGFLGQVNFRDETHIFVNLRCMQIFDTSAYLYAGGGITAHSQPQKEWQETIYKMQTLLNVLSNNT